MPTLTVYREEWIYFNINILFGNKKTKHNIKN